MRGKVISRWLSVALMIFGGILILLHSRASSQQPPTVPEPPVSLRYRAGATGHYIGYAGPSTSPTYTDLSQVTLLSGEIIIGTALSNRCNLSPDGNFITIDYQVRIDSKLKGSLSTSNIITVSLPGGKVGFIQPDGTTAYAEIRTPWFTKMENGKQYYLFLSKTGSLARRFRIINFEPTGGPQGVFEIVNGVVKSNSGRLRDPIWQYHNTALSDFNNLVRNLVTTPVPTPTPPPAMMSP